MERQPTLTARPDPMMEMLVEVLNRTGQARVRVHGNSMRPFINDGEIVRMRKCMPSEIIPGDVVACVRGGHLVVHRLLWKNRNLLHLKADAFPVPDAPISPDNLLGKVTLVETENGALDLEQFSARRLNMLVMLYMLPVSAAYSLRALIPARRSRERGLIRVSFIRRMLEWFPQQTARRLVKKP